MGVPEAESMVSEACVESVPLALALRPVYSVVLTPVPFVHSWAEVSELEKVMSAHYS